MRPSREAGGPCSASHFLLLRMGSWQAFPGVSNWDQSSMAHLRERMETDIDAAWKLWHLLAGGSAFPSRILRQCPCSSGWGSGSESERVARLWRRHRQARARKTGEDDCRADAILEEISRILSEHYKAAIAKWRDDMKNRGLAARWVKSRSIVGVDLQHHVNWADEDHFEYRSCHVPPIWQLPRSLRQDGILELMSWTGICLVCNCRELRMRLFAL